MLDSSRSLSIALLVTLLQLMGISVAEGLE
jgi:hypothetical protein